MMDPPRLSRNLFLVGLRGTGKSTVGQLVATRLNVLFFDADVELETRTGRTIRDIFSLDGEPAFRDLEEKELVTLSELGPAVIATGGGVILRAMNRQRMRETGKVVWLTASVDEMCRRLQHDSSSADRRPALTVGGRVEVEQLLLAREPLYRECADWIVETEGRSPGDIAEAILDSCSTSF